MPVPRCQRSQLIPAYELDITLSWEGQLTDGSGAVLASPRGRIHLPYVSDENHDEVPEMRFSGEADDTATQRIREAFLSQGKQVGLRALLGQGKPEWGRISVCHSCASPQPSDLGRQVSVTGLRRQRFLDQGQRT